MFIKLYFWSLLVGIISKADMIDSWMYLCNFRTTQHLLFQFESWQRKLFTCCPSLHNLRLLKKHVQGTSSRSSADKVFVQHSFFPKYFFLISSNLRWMVNGHKNVRVWKHFCPNNEKCRLRLWYKCIGQVYRPENQQSTGIFWQLNNTQRGYFSHKRVDIRHFYEALNQEMTTRIEFYAVAQPRRGCWFEQNKWAVFLTIKSKCWH